MRLLLLVGSGGALGCILRYIITTLCYQWFGRDFPFGTLLINVIGAFLIGLAFIIITDYFHASAQNLYALVIIGFLGGFTTFSAFSLETVSMLQNGLFYRASLYILLSVTICLMSTVSGLWLGRYLLDN